MYNYNCTFKSEAFSHFVGMFVPNGYFFHVNLVSLKYNNWVKGRIRFLRIFIYSDDGLFWVR